MMDSDYSELFKKQADIAGIRDPEKLLKLVSRDPKYFSPLLEDIRVGYEAEFLRGKGAIGQLWSKVIIDRGNLQISLRDIKHFRTPYLTKEQIEAEGWKETGWMYQKWFEKGNYGLKLLKDNRIVIIMKDVLLDEDAEKASNGQIYLGNCPSINEFRYITRNLLKIN